MPFEPGKPKTGGRQKGSQNRLTRTVKETVLSVFNDIQDDPKVNLTEFAKKYPRDFYNIAAKLIPTEIQAQVKQTTVVWNEEKTYEAKPEANQGT